LRISAASCVVSSPCRTRAADAAPDVEAALTRLQKVDGRPLRILICGSLYLAGQVLALQEGVQAQTN
jgi:dihydrofolate synthase/folylpolyglutamate synthase